MRKKLILFLIIIILALMIVPILYFLPNNRTKSPEVNTAEQKPEPIEESLINPEGTTLESRIHTPSGFKRVKAEEDSLVAFLRGYAMKEDGSPVLLYDGREKSRSDVAVAVFTLPLENEDLQQCADSVMRVWGEYYYQRGEYSKITFSLGGGFVANFQTWSEGDGIGIDDDRLFWKSNRQNDGSYESFKKFMRIVFAYSGTLNMAEDSRKINQEELQVGDIFIKGGSPGHVVMVVDICKDQDGRKAFLLAQGYMPAQEFHVINNPLHDDDPWYYVDEIVYPFRTAEYTFPEGSLRRYK